MSSSSNYLAVFHCVWIIRSVVGLSKGGQLLFGERIAMKWVGPVKDETNQEVWLNLELATSMAAMGNGVTKVTFAGGNTVGVQEKPTKMINARLVQS